MSKKKAKGSYLKLRTFSKLLLVVSIIFILLLAYFIFDANILPVKYLFIVLGVFFLLAIIQAIFIMNRKTKIWLIIIIDILTFAVMSAEAFAIVKINETISFLRENLGLKYRTDVYNIVVHKDSNVKSIQDLNGKTVVGYKDLEDMSKVEEECKKKATFTITYEEDLMGMLNKITEDKELIILVNSGNYDVMAQTDEKYADKVRIVDTIEIKTIVEQEESHIKITEEPFVVYLSGVDTRSNYLPSRSLSDVNIILAVNPKEKRILMIHIPRDYYVQIHGKPGLKDKLTHSGGMGGVELTMQTIEDLLEIKIPYYVRVNFNALVNLVDAIGGINIDSDIDIASCWTDRSCSFHKGLNSVGGRCALAFARERYAYATGDRHRGENQEQVLSLIIDKITSSSTLISRYSEILEALNGTFETNLTTDEITSLVKMQIDDMAKWKMETYNVDGQGNMLPTYSYPNLNLYVMEPKMETVTAAVAKLDEILGTKNEEKSKQE